MWWIPVGMATYAIVRMWVYGRKIICLMLACWMVSDAVASDAFTVQIGSSNPAAVDVNIAQVVGQNAQTISRIGPLITDGAGLWYGYLDIIPQLGDTGYGTSYTSSGTGIVAITVDATALPIAVTLNGHNISHLANDGTLTFRGDAGTGTIATYMKGTGTYASNTSAVIISINNLIVSTNATTRPAATTQVGVIDPAAALLGVESDGRTMYDGAILKAFRKSDDTQATGGVLPDTESDPEQPLGMRIPAGLSVSDSVSAVEAYNALDRLMEAVSPGSMSTAMAGGIGTLGDFLAVMLSAVSSYKAGYSTFVTFINYIVGAALVWVTAMWCYRQMVWGMGFRDPGNVRVPVVSDVAEGVLAGGDDEPGMDDPSYAESRAYAAARHDGSIGMDADD